jgi:flagellar protein FlaI
MSCKSTPVLMGGKRILKFDCGNCEHGASIEQSEACMHGVINRLAEDPAVDAVILADPLYEREYRESCLDALKELAQVYEDCRYWPLKSLALSDCTRCEAERKQLVENIIEELPGHPWKAYNDMVELSADVRAQSKRGSEKCRSCREYFLKNSLEATIEAIQRAKLVSTGKRGRKGYAEIITSLTKPHFSASRIAMNPPLGAKLVDAYKLEDSEVRIYSLPNGLQHFYFLIMPEYRLPPEHLALLNRTRELLLGHGLDGMDLSDPAHARRKIKRMSARLMAKQSVESKLDITRENIETLAECLTKFSVGLGVLETMLSDVRVQDVYIDAPVGKSPLHIYHGDYEECLTNVYLTQEDAESLSSRFRAISGRPFSEADPVLDLNLAEFGARVAAIGRPLSPEGVAFTLRRHKTTPWTLPQFVQNMSLAPEAAGLLSLLVDSQASILIAGSRGAGKTSLLGALMLEIPQKFRIISIEDTLELPISRLQALGFKIQSLHVQSATTGSEVELRAEDALRAALRLGESVLVIGEVRGAEAKVLYEAMRIGAAGNSVMGTIHGATTRDVFERVVYDLGIPATSFKATDAIVVAAPIRPGGSVSRVRRVVQITEVGKDWKVDPTVRRGFADLMVYNQSDDQLKPTKRLRESSQLLEAIARKWGIKEVDVVNNLELRARVQWALVKKSAELNMPKLLEARSVVASNNALHQLLEEQLRLHKTIDCSETFQRWQDWLKGEISG